MMTEDLTTRQTIHDFVVSTFLFDNGDVADDASLLGEGIMDSTGVLELVLFVEETFGIRVADDEILPENFDSIARIAVYVARKGGGLVEAAS
ncbi:MAG TPA: acyl carrier protein [Gemmataceae bacterium]|nr:acyl carrier protein [Gemmataceae bacterium]